MKIVIEQIVDLIHQRGISNNSTPQQQGVKLMYAYGKLCNAIDNNDVNSIVEHIGDVAFVAIIICMQTNNYIAVNEIYPNRHDSQDLLWHIINLAENLRDIIYDDDYVENTLAYLTVITQHYNLSFEECLQNTYKRNYV